MNRQNKNSFKLFSILTCVFAIHSYAAGEVDEPEAKNAIEKASVQPVKKYEYPDN